MPMRKSRMIPRHRFIKVINSLACERAIYICAPAGYGKTVSIRQWLLQSELCKAMIFLDECDNDQVHFCRRFCSALQDCQPKNASLLKAILNADFCNMPIEAMISAITTLSGRMRTCIVLDDMHYIHNEEILKLIMTILKQLPECFQIIMLSREKLPSMFSNLFIKGIIVNIGICDLLFDKEEITLMYGKRGYHITGKQADEIFNYTEGWVVAINALLLQGKNVTKESLKALDEFIEADIWDKYDEGTREFMLKASVAKELSPPLCAVLTGVLESEELLCENMLIRQVKNGLYRYNAPFHRFLKNMAGKRGNEFLLPLSQKAGEWYLSQGDFYNAIEYFIQCESYDGIAKCFHLLESIGRKSFKSDKVLSILCSPVIEGAIAKYPFLLIPLTWKAYALGQHEEMIKYIDMYYIRYDEVVKSSLSFGNNLLFMNMLDFRVSTYSLKQIVNEYINTTYKSHMTAIITMNIPIFHRSIRDFSRCINEAIQTEAPWILEAFKELLGEEGAMLTKCLIAGVLYEQGHLVRAHEYALMANMEIKQHYSLEARICAISILIYILDALEQTLQADHTLSRLMAMIEMEEAHYLNYNIKALAIRRKLSKGNITAAHDWLKDLKESSFEDLTYFGIYGHITTCRAYIAIGDYDAAIIFLVKMLEIAYIYERPLSIIELHILLSIAYWKMKRGFQKEGIKHLELAICMAYDYGYTQLFVNEGIELTGMLSRLQHHAAQSNSESRVPTSFIKMLYLKQLTYSKQNEGLTSGQPIRPIVYTDKQRMVMKGLCEGKSYREIAEIMGIKISTLRSHIALIYKKLDVTNETDAVMRINLLGLLDE